MAANPSVVLHRIKPDATDPAEENRDQYICLQYMSLEKFEDSKAVKELIRVLQDPINICCSYSRMARGDCSLEACQN